MYARNKPVLDFILHQNDDSECPHIKVDVCGIKIYALLDSGANKVFLGGSGWSLVKNLGFELLKTDVSSCVLGDNSQLSCIGEVNLPLKLKDKVKVFRVNVVPEIRHMMIVGTEFWIRMGVIPDLRKGEWYFSSKSNPHLFSTETKTLKAASELTTEQRKQLNTVVNEYFESIKDIPLGCTKEIEHKIVTTSPPIRTKYYRVSPYMQKLIDEELNHMLELGVVEKSNSSWSSPILMIPKKDNTYRFCVDFRKLNRVSERSAYPLPFISSILDKLGNCRYLTSLDIRYAYWQIPLEESSKKYTAFTIPGRGLYQFTRMPFGLHGAPATCQSLVDKILGPGLEPYTFTYLDDIIIATPDFDTHLSTLAEVLKRLKNAGLTLRHDKCVFAREELKFLGYVVNRAGLNVDPEKVSAILNIPTPRNVREVRRIVGMMSWYRKFIPNFSTKLAPLTRLTKKRIKFQWTPECDKALRDVKDALVKAPILACPNFEYPFILQCDASAYGLGAVLTQNIDGQEKVICYLSRSLTPNERKFTTTERECLSVIWAIEKLRCYLEGVRFTVITDHYSLLWLDNLKDPQGRLGRWALRLQQFDFQLIHRKGGEHVVPDCLSRAVPTLDNIVLEQENGLKDPWYNKMRELVTNNPRKYPAWRVVDDILYKYVSVKFPEMYGDEEPWKKVVPKEERKKLLEIYHDSPRGGHLGIYKTYQRILTSHYWPKMQADVKKYVNKCKICSQMKPEQRRPAGEMGSRPQISRCWQMISTDLIGPFPKSKKGYMYILSVTDCFSKFCLHFPLKRATSPPIIKAIEESVFLLFGVPEFIICDNGKQYTSKEFKQFLKRYNVKSMYNALYHPQNNPVERLNRVTKTMIASYIEEDQREWDTHLAELGCAYRTAKHEVLRQTPYYVNFGMEMITDGKEYEEVRHRQEIGGHENETVEAHEEVKNRSGRLQQLRKYVKRVLEEAYKRTKQKYNLRRRPVTYEEGDKVWKREHKLSDAGRYYAAKLGPKYGGPFRIRKKLGINVYELENDKGKSLGNWHVKDLKPDKTLSEEK